MQRIATQYFTNKSIHKILSTGMILAKRLIYGRFLRYLFFPAIHTHTQYLVFWIYFNLYLDDEFLDGLG